LFLLSLYLLVFLFSHTSFANHKTKTKTAKTPAAQPWPRRGTTDSYGVTMGAPPTLRKYDNYAEWIYDFDDLLERRYKDVPPEKFIGLYVQPGSPNWIYGVNQVIEEFEQQQIEALDVI
jgi:hypothetical protein